MNYMTLSGRFVIIPLEAHAATPRCCSIYILAIIPASVDIISFQFTLGFSVHYIYGIFHHRLDPNNITVCTLNS
jgi:hypothetical protein